MRSLTLLILVAMTEPLRGDVVDLAPKRERKIAAIEWTDDTGRARQLSELSGYPLVLLPIYTRCRSACVQNVDRLKNVLVDSDTDITQLRVLLFSFDATDTPATLARYRQRENIPLGWSIGTASQANIDALLDSIGVQVGKAGIEFTHPNILIFLDPLLRIAKWIYGTDYSKGDFDHAVQVAAGRRDWIGQHSDVLYAFLLFGASILCVALAVNLRQLRLLRRFGCSRHSRPSPVGRT